jgi:phage-related protein
VPGGNGQYFFKTNYKNRQISIPIAFDQLSKEEFYNLKKWLKGDSIHELSFDERPEVKYSAKVTGTPQLKFICFDEEYEETINEVVVTRKRNIYKGEGTIQFTCYFPFGYGEEQTKEVDIIRGATITDDFTISTELPTTFVLTAASTNISDGDVFEIGNLKITLKKSGNSLEWDTATGLVKIDGEPAPYIGTSYGTISTGTYTVNRKSYPYTIKYKSLYY